MVAGQGKKKTNVKKVGFSDRNCKGKISWRQTENEKETSRKAAKQSASRIFPVLYHVSLISVSIPVLVSHTQPLLRLQPFATLDLVLNESQSNSNPQISESSPP